MLAACLAGGGVPARADREDPARLAAAELGDLSDFKRRRELRGWFETALVGKWDRRAIDDVPLGDLVPPARVLPDARVGPRELDSRSRGALRRAGTDRWSDLLDTSLGRLVESHGRGPAATASLLGACFERGLAGAAAAAGSRADGATGRDDLAALLEAERRAACQPVLESLLESTLGPAGAPADEGPGLGGTARRLLRRSAPWALDSRTPILELTQAIADDLDRSIFERCELGWGRRSSLPELGAELGVSSTRVAQRRDRAGAQLRDQLEASPAPLPWVASRVRRALGTAAPRQAVLDELRRHELEEPGGTGDAARAASLLLWLAGPYRHDAQVEGWMVAGADDLASRTKAELVKDAGVRPLGEVEAWLTRLGVAPRLSLPWLRACGAATVDGVLTVWLSGQLPDVLERLLDAHGRGLSVADCAALLESGGRPALEADVERALRGRRFRAAAGDTFELAAWPPPGASARLRTRSARSSDGATKCARQDGAGVTPGDGAADDGEGVQLSLPGVEQLPPLDAGRAGSVSIGPAPEAVAGSEPRSARPAAVRAWLTVEVDPPLTAGSPAPVPPALVRALGLGLGQRRTFASRYGPVTISNDGPEPTRGPLRPLALGAGAEPGDSLVLGFGPDGDVLVQLIGQAEAFERLGGAS